MRVPDVLDPVELALAFEEELALALEFELALELLELVASVEPAAEDDVAWATIIAGIASIPSSPPSFARVRFIIFLALALALVRTPAAPASCLPSVAAPEARCQRFGVCVRHM